MSTPCDDDVTRELTRAPQIQVIGKLVRQVETSDATKPGLPAAVAKGMRATELGYQRSENGEQVTSVMLRQSALAGSIEAGETIRRGSVFLRWSPGAMQLSRGAALFGMLAMLGQGAAEGSELQFSVSRDAVRCVMQNRQKYEGISKDPVIIFLKLCPSVDPSPEQIATLNRATGGILIKELLPGSPLPPRSVIVLNRRQLTCFLGQLKAGEPLALRSGKASVAVDLAKCK